MPDLARTLITLGAILLCAGLIVAGLGRLHLPIGRLPGDISFRTRNTSFSFPVVSCLLLSVLLSLVLWIAGRLHR